MLGKINYIKFIPGGDPDIQVRKGWRQSLNDTNLFGMRHGHSAWMGGGWFGLDGMWPGYIA